MRRTLTRFLSEERGNIALLFSIALFPVVGLAGASTDYAQASAAKASLQTSLDAAALAAARDNLRGQDELKAFITAYLEPHMRNADVASWSLTEVLAEGGRVSATANADIATNFIGLFGIAHLRVDAEAEALRELGNLELALVLDNTGSMSNGNMIGALRTSAASLVDILYETPEADERVRIGLVPYVTAVNIKAEGAFRWHWIDTEGIATHHGENFDADPVPASEGGGGGASKSRESISGSAGGEQHAQWTSNHLDMFDGMGVAWKGCVEARAAPYDLTLAVPDEDEPDTLFVPYLWPDTPDNASADYKNNYLNDQTGGSAEERQRDVRKYYAGNPNPAIDETPPTTRGPNKSCPQPLVPLTNDMNRLKQDISAMQPWDDSGTNTAEGMAWGWRILTPEEPFTEAAPRNTDGLMKAMVVMTDGENQIWGGYSTHNRSDYSAYGFLERQRLGTADRNQAKNVLNDKMRTLCKRVKADEIRVYTITFKVTATATRNLFRDCASSPDLYFNSPTNADLQEAFESIAGDLTNLRLSR